MENEDSEQTAEEFEALLATMKMCERQMGAKFNDYYVPTSWWAKHFDRASAFETELYALRKNIANSSGKMDTEGVGYLRAVTKHYAQSFPEVFYQEYAERFEVHKLQNLVSDLQDLVSEFNSFKESLRRRIRSLDADSKPATPEEDHRIARRVLQDVADDLFGGRRFYDPQSDSTESTEQPNDGIAN